MEDVDFQRDKLHAVLRNEALPDAPTCKKFEPVNETTLDPEVRMDIFKRRGEKTLIKLL